MASVNGQFSLRDKQSKVRVLPIECVDTFIVNLCEKNCFHPRFFIHTVRSGERSSQQRDSFMPHGPKLRIKNRLGRLSVCKIAKTLCRQDKYSSVVALVLVRW